MLMGCEDNFTVPGASQEEDLWATVTTVAPDIPHTLDSASEFSVEALDTLVYWVPDAHTLTPKDGCMTERTAQS